MKLHLFKKKNDQIQTLSPSLKKFFLNHYPFVAQPNEQVESNIDIKSTIDQSEKNSAMEENPSSEEKIDAHDLKRRRFEKEADELHDNGKVMEKAREEDYGQDTIGNGRPDQNAPVELKQTNCSIDSNSKNAVSKPKEKSKNAPKLKLKTPLDK